MFRLVINSQEIDGLNPNLIVLNKPVFNLTQLDTRGIIASNNIILPRTGKNNSIFNLLSEDPIGQTFSMELYEDSALLVLGDAVIKSLSRDSFKIQLRERAKTFFEDIKRPLSDLNLLSDDFIFNRTNFDLFKVTNSTVWNWLGVDSRNLQVGSAPSYFNTSGVEVNLTNRGVSRPSYKVLSILEKIIEDAGLNADLTEAQELAGYVMPSNTDNFYFSELEMRFQSVAVTAGNSIDFSTGIFIYTPVNFYNLTLNKFIINTIRPSKYVVSGTIDKTDDVILNLNVLDQNNFARNTTQVTIKGGQINFVTDEYVALSRLDFTFDQDVTLVDFRITGLIEEIQYYTATGFVWPNGDSTIQGWNRVNSSAVVIPLLEDYLIKAAYNLPNITQFEFIQELWKTFWLDIDITGDTAKVTLNKNIKKSEALELDNTVGRGEITELTIFNRENIFKYTNDEDLLEEYAQKILKIDNESLSGDTKTFIELVASASVESTILQSPYNDFKLGNLPIYTETTPANTNESDRSTLGLRFLLSTDRDIDTTIETEIGTQSYFQNSSLTDVPNPIDLTFESLYNVFYSFVFDNIVSNRSFNIKKHMTFLEYLSILDKKVYYIKEFGRYFLVLDISKFNPGRETSIKLVSY